MKEGNEFAILTDEITHSWSGMKTNQYKKFKSLKKESLRDNMTNLELVLNMLGEVSTIEISKTRKPETFVQNKGVAKAGGKIAGGARKQIERQTRKKVITSANFLSLNKKKQLD